ncbi:MULTISPECIES: DUF6155 family protein [unclassified Clostridium]|uniref:DUF6155 family protein n=1 Tax=unclassified Clostridium TaxID=2614128 RepID=UPI00196AF901|nr:DUF6155 family protein [Clostridium sp. JN-9]
MSNLKINDLKSYLKDKSNDGLIKEIIELTKQFPEVKQYYGVKLNPASETEVFEKYKKIIENEFFPDRGLGKMRYSNVNKAISDFKKISNNTQLIAELMLYYAEVGVEFTNEFGDIDERFYNTIERAYNNALEYIFKNDLQEKFKNKADEIKLNTGCIGWGFNENMNEIYYDYYSDFEGE